MSDLTQDWKKPYVEGIEFILPSGKRAKLRPVGIETFIRLGKIPDTLTPYIQQMIAEPDKAEFPDTRTLEDFLSNMDFLNTFAELCFVEPKVVDGPATSDAFSAWDIAPRDKLAVVQFLNQPVEVLQSFRDIQTGAVEVVDTAGDNGGAAEPAATDQPVGEAALAR